VGCVLLAGCASTWSVRTSEGAGGLQWPFEPGRAKVRYVRSLLGFVPDTSAGTVVKAIVFGSEDEESNAFLLPVAVALGGDGRIAIADMGRRCVHLYLPGKKLYRRLVGGEKERMISPVGVIFDDEGRLYVTDSGGRLFAFDEEGALRFTRDSVGVEKLQRPTGIAFSPRMGWVYVVDTLANKVFALDTEGDMVFAFGARGEGAGEFNFPTHLFHSAAGELFVTDALNFRIVIFDERGKYAGAFGRHGDGSGDLAMPKGVAVDGDGVVYVVDGMFDNVQLFNRQGEFLLTVGQRGTGAGEFWLPSGAFISANRELYVCDTYNRRIQIFRITEGYGDAAS